MIDRAEQSRIAAELEVVTRFDAGEQVEARVAFLADYLVGTGAAGYVLGISGGVDSAAAGRLCQLACERVRAAGGSARFVAMRLPYRLQRDESDAQRSLQFIGPDETLTVDIGPATDAAWQSCLQAGLTLDPPTQDYVKGNVKARQRMIAQFTVAGARGMLVVGTDHAAEAVVGFFTKFGDGACDLTPLTGLPKRRVRQLAEYLGAEPDMVAKVPTADLESDRPLRADEAALGVSYQEIDDYLEGLPVSAEAEATILGWYRRTGHKRAMPVTPGIMTG
ncbi:MAG TPA: ammonia-dependent NAD(+) synthetase [Dermatophilaceae bacterium]|nr:ammonia-dependent NAD(+) synthetase [Dermatophilaceae bacterium]